jgi:hypothetical protein
LKKIHCINTSTVSKEFFQAFVLLPLIILILLSVAACGKKSKPTLAEYEKPYPPEVLPAIHREEKIIIRWNYPAEKEKAVADFIILKSSGAEFKKLLHIEKSNRSYEDTDFETGGNYRYKIIAQSFKGIYSDDSNIIVISPLAVPSPPSDLSFTIQDHSLLLTWEPERQGLLYNVYKSTEKGKYGLSPVNSSPISGNSFRDSFSVAKTVYYTVRSLHATEIRDEGAPSGELAVDPSELIPSALKNIAYHVSSDRVFIYWDEPDEFWVTGFRIYRRTEGRDYLMVGETQTPGFTDMEPALTIRDYRLHAVGPVKEGPGIEIRGVKYTVPPE